MRVAKAICGISIVIGLAACNSDSSSVSSGGSKDDTATTSAPTVSASVPLALSVYTIYEGTTAEWAPNFTETGTNVCQSTDTNPAVTCSVVIPEARLYLSSLNLHFSWMTDKCKLLHFQPYMYRASVSAAYTPPGQESPIDCSTDPSASCWGGAAPLIIGSFPKYFGNIYIPDEKQTTGPQSKLETIPSAHSIAYGSNRVTANDLDSSKIATTYTSAQLGGGGDGYVASTYVDYTWNCRDDWYDPKTYQITLKVTDEDSEADPQLDHLNTWREAP